MTLDNPASARVSMGFAVLLLLDNIAHGGKDFEISNCLWKTNTLPSLSFTKSVSLLFNSTYNQTNVTIAENILYQMFVL